MSAYLPSKAEVEAAAISRHEYLNGEGSWDRAAENIKDRMREGMRAGLVAAHTVAPEAAVDPARYWRERAEQAERERDQWRDALTAEIARSTPREDVAESIIALVARAPHAMNCRWHTWNTAPWRESLAEPTCNCWHADLQALADRTPTPSADMVPAAALVEEVDDRGE